MEPYLLEKQHTQVAQLQTLPHACLSGGHVCSASPQEGAALAEAVPRTVDGGPWDTVVIGAGSGHRFSGHRGLVVTIGHSSVCGRLAVYLVASWENTATVSLCDLGLG